MSDIEKRVEAIQGIRRAFDKVKHHAKLTKKLETAIKEELPAYSVSFSNDDWGKLTVWGNGLSYDNGVFLCWNSDRTKSDWQQVIQEQIDIADSSDYQERLQQESVIEPNLAELASRAKRLEEEPQKVRKKKYKHSRKSLKKKLVTIHRGFECRSKELIERANYIQQNANNSFSSLAQGLEDAQTPRSVLEERATEEIFHDLMEQLNWLESDLKHLKMAMLIFSREVRLKILPESS
jgi:hypothetical protein